MTWALIAILWVVVPAWLARATWVTRARRDNLANPWPPATIHRIR